MAKKVLVVVDYQNDFVNGVLGFKKAEGLDDGIAEEIRMAHKQGYDIICTMDTHDSKDYMNTEEGKNLPVMHCPEGEHGWKLYGKTEKAAKDTGALLLTKPTFPCQELFLVLKGMDKIDKCTGGEGITEVKLCGVVTNMCVISNVVVSKMAVPNAHIVVIEHLCASFDDDAHNKAIDVMKSMQVEVI